MTNMIRKTPLQPKGGPGGVGLRFDPVTKSLKTNDGTNTKLIDQSSDGVEVKTAAFTVTNEDHGKIFALTLLAGIVVTLPSSDATTRGLKVTFQNALLPTSNDYRIAPASGEAIKYGTADQDIINTAGTDVLGDSVTLVADGAGGWAVTAQVGIWAKG